jgi:hypothetical protein
MNYPSAQAGRTRQRQIRPTKLVEQIPDLPIRHPPLFEHCRRLKISAQVGDALVLIDGPRSGEINRYGIPGHRQVDENCEYTYQQQ